MNKRHPRRRIRTDTGHSYVKHATCGSRTGRHLACGGSSLSDFSKYGLGIDLYFKFMVETWCCVDGLPPWFCASLFVVSVCSRRKRWASCCFS
jgi:hypothetical protein